MLENLPRRLKQARGKLSQEKLAEAVGVTPHSIYLFERGQDSKGKPMRPSLETLGKIAEATSRDLSWFFGDAEPRAGPPRGSDAEVLAALIGQAVANAVEPLGQKLDKLTGEVQTMAAQEQGKAQADERRRRA